MAEILNVKDVAKILRVSERTVQREVEVGKLEAFRVGKSLRFTTEAIERYMREQRVTPSEKAEDAESEAEQKQKVVA